MPRRCRQVSDTKVYHVMLRGNERRKIFFNDEDRARFIAILKAKNKERLFSIYAFCLMDNHVHLLINEQEEQITKIMHKIGVSYAQYLNKKYQRTGHLFQDRFKSEAIQDERYLLAAIRYIHNNPIKANMVKKPGQFRWSSYHEYVNEGSNDFDVIDKTFVLSMFSEDAEQAVKLFVKYSEESQNGEAFMDIPDEDVLDKRMNEEEVRLYINECIAKYDQADLKALMLVKEIRNELIREIKRNSTLSIRQIAGILGIDRNIVQRVK